jgi:hypothetical protein
MPALGASPSGGVRQREICNLRLSSAVAGPHFERVQGIMLRVLTIWSSLNPAISYRQGMHELLAPLLVVLERDGQCGDEGTADSEAGLLGCVTDKDFTEHDAYALFEKLMAVISESFAPQERKKTTDGQYARPGGVVARCDHMHNTLLRSKDYELYIHLQSQHVEPQLYSMKWIRLLLGREFQLEDVLALWDALFADHLQSCSKGSKPVAGGRGLELLEYVCVAMIIYIRADLLGKDNMGCLQSLMKYPPVNGIKVFVTSALKLRDNSTATPASTPDLRPLPPKPAGPPPAAAAAQPPPAPQRAGDNGNCASTWLLGSGASSSSSSGSVAAPSGGNNAGGGGGGGGSRGGSGGQVAFVGGQVVHVGSGAGGGGGGASGSASSAARAPPVSGSAAKDLMNGALSVKMNGPLATLERMLPPVGDARRPEMQRALESLRQVCLDSPALLPPCSRLPRRLLAAPSVAPRAFSSSPLSLFSSVSARLPSEETWLRRAQGSCIALRACVQTLTRQMSQVQQTLAAPGSMSAAHTSGPSHDGPPAQKHQNQGSLPPENWSFAGLVVVQIISL